MPIDRNQVGKVLLPIETWKFIAAQSLTILYKKLRFQSKSVVRVKLQFPFFSVHANTANTLWPKANKFADLQKPTLPFSSCFQGDENLH